MPTKNSDDLAVARFNRLRRRLRQCLDGMQPSNRAYPVLKNSLAGLDDIARTMPPAFIATVMRSAGPLVKSMDDTLTQMGFPDVDDSGPGGPSPSGGSTPRDPNAN